MLQKLLTYARKLDPKDEVEQYATEVQTEMLVRIAVSAAFEAWRSGSTVHTVSMFLLKM